LKYLSWIFVSSVCYGNNLIIPEPFFLDHEFTQPRINGSTQAQVVGGSPVLDTSSFVYKSTVRILAKGLVAAPAPGLEGKTISWRCSGVYLTNMIILTAAHCVPGLINYNFEGKTYIAKFDRQKFEVFSVIKAGQNEFSGVKVTASVRHPRFEDLWFTKRSDSWNPKTEVYDLALLKLEYPLEYQKEPVSSIAEISNSGETLTIAGYGKNNPVAEFDIPELRQAQVPFKERLLNGADFVLGKGNFAKPGKVSEPVGGCSGDSGGPVYRNLTNGKLAVVGVTSRGPDESGGGCMSSLTIATGIWPYLAWIKDTLEKL